MFRLLFTPFSVTRLATSITDSHPRLATGGWLDLTGQAFHLLDYSPFSGRTIPIYQIEQGCSVPLESKITGTLKTQLTDVALHKHSVVRTTYSKLHAVAALYLKGHIIGRERMRHRIVRMVARNFRALCHNLPQPLPERSAAANGCFYSMC